MKGEVVDAEYDPDRNVVEYTAELENGDRVSGLLTDSVQGPGMVIRSDAMEQLAEQLVGTSVDVDVEQLQTGAVQGYSIGLDTDSL